MVPPIKYSFELLQNFCNDNNVKLSDNYENHPLFGSTKIKFFCTTCNKENVKCFTYLIKRNTLCKKCVTIASLPKKKGTMIKKYGVEHASQNKDILNKTKEYFIKKYGVDNPAKNQQIKNKQKQTNLKKYGVEYIIHNKKSKEKMINTNLEKYGTKCCLENINIKEKIKITNLKKYGVENVGQYKDFNKKMKTTMLNKYGVEYPLQNSEIAHKASKKGYNSKPFIFPSGKEIKCQGYEPFALQELINKNIEEDYILTGPKNVPKLWYYDDNNIKRRHYVDIFISNQNKCIEVKSIWTLKKKNSFVFLKQKYAKELGYEYEIWVYDSNGNKVETFI